MSVPSLSGNLDLFDTELVTRLPVEIRATADAPTERALERDARAAAAASPDPGDLDDLEARAFGDGSLGRKIEAEPHGVRQHRAQRADLEDDTRDAGTARALCDDGDDLLGDPQLMHGPRPPP